MEVHTFMNEILQRISKDIEREQHSLPESVISELKLDSYTVDEVEFVGKLVMVAGEYLVEMEKLEEEKKQLRSEICKLNKLFEELRRYYSIPYKQILAKKIEKSITPAKKVVSEKAVKDLEQLDKTDTEICDILGISRSTLWRKRKQWQSNNYNKSRVTEHNNLRFNI